VEEINIWLATSVPLNDPELLLFSAENMAPIVTTPGCRSVRLGKRLFVHMLTVRPVRTLFPAGEPIAYDIDVDAGRRLADLMNVKTISLPGFELPTLVLQEPEAGKLHALYGSCRKAHGPAPDMMQAAARILRDPDEGRPEVFFLGGDQIYADDVSGELLPHLTVLGAELMGKPEFVVGVPPHLHVPGADRSKFLGRAFTSGEMENHLLTFGEWVAMYLFSWNPEMWIRTSRFPDEAAIPHSDASYGARESQLALANVVTYTTFDDHEITDDWFLNHAWMKKTRRLQWPNDIMLNGLCAYWAFQGWGNDPAAFTDEQLEAVVTYVGGGDSTPAKAFMLKGDGWSYLAPTSPPTLVLDTRTMREESRDYKDVRPPYKQDDNSPLKLKYGYEPAPINTTRDVNAARLLGTGMRKRLRELVAEASTASPLIVIAPAPIFGFRPIEEVQELVGGYSAAAGDLESWAANSRNIVDFVRLLFGGGIRFAVVLSGDVHYGFEMAASISAPNSTVHVAQLCSSAIKNHPTGYQGVGAKVLRHTGVRGHEIAWWDWASGDDDGPITRFHVNNSMAFRDLLDKHKPSFTIAERLHDRDGGGVIVKNNLGELKVDEKSVTNRFWIGNGHRITATDHTTWTTDNWPAPRVWHE
jgi:hypothetical protein